MKLDPPVSVNPRYVEVLRYLYPNVDVFADFNVQDFCLGDGPQLTMWNLPGDYPDETQVQDILDIIDTP